MISIYASYFRQNGSIITDWTLIQKIPATDGELILTKPTVKCDMGNAESMDFAIYPGTPYFDAFMQMRSYIRVEYEDTSIFYGRVLTIENGYYGERRIHCEGALSLLNDSQCPPVESNEKTEISILDHITQVIENHNQQLNDPYKTFYLGEIPGHYSASISPEQQIPNESREYGNTGWTDTKAILEDMRSHYGGCFRTRFEGNKIYLDWMNHYFNSQPNSQIIEVGKNLIDLSDITEVSNIFTVIIPIGKSEGSKGSDSKLYLNGYKPEVHGEGIYLRVPDICKSLNPESVYTDEELDSGYHLAEDYKNAINNYGYIFKPVEIQEATTQEALFLKAAEWIKNNYQGGIDSFSIRAVDLHFLDPVDYQKILCGEQFVIRYPVGTEDGSVVLTERLLTCTAITYDLYNPENNQYSFGIPANMLTRNYATKSSKNPKDKISSPTYGGGGGEPELSQYDKWVEKVRSWLRSHKVWKKSTGGRESGPNAQTGARDDYNYFLYPSIEHAVDGAGRAWKRLWFPVYMSAIIKHDWVRDSKGRPIGNWSLHDPDPDKFDLIKLVNSHHLFEYIIDEYGIDLRNGLSVKMPSVTTDDEGNTTIWTTDENGKIVPSIDVNSELGIKLLSMSGQNELVMDKFGNVGYYKDTEDGRKVLITFDIDGNLHYLDEDGNETNIRDLTITAYDSKDKIGWVVTENQQGEKEFANPGEMTMAIEKHNGGELVVTKLSGELMYLGNTKTDRIMTTSVQHMDQVTGDVEYVPDETDPTIKVFKINSGGGMRVTHGKKVLKKGPDGKPLDPNDPANWEYETVTDPETGEKKIVTADFGVYDNNTLVGGILSEKLNDGTVKTLIKGTILDMKAEDWSRWGVWTNGNITSGGIIGKINGNSQTDKILGNKLDPKATDFAAWGVYTNNTLTGGVLVEKINDKSTTTSILGTRIDMKAEDWSRWGVWTNGNITSGGIIGKINGNSQTDKILGNKLDPKATDFAAWGVYTNNTLTGGVLVEKINDKSTTTSILGTRIDMKAEDWSRWGVWTNGNITSGGIIGKINGNNQTDKILGNKLDPKATDFASWGVYTNNTLTGGVLVEKINDKSTTSKIIGTRVDIEAKQVRIGNTSTVEAWMSTTDTWKTTTDETLDDYAGLIANRATIGQLNSQKARIDTLETKAITTDNLSAKIANIPTLKGMAATFSGNVSGAAGMFSSVYIGSGTSYVNISNPITEIQITGPTNNKYTLQYKRAKDTTWQDAESFSRATLLRGKWSGNTLEVTADPNGKSKVVETIGSRFNLQSGQYYIAATRADARGNITDLAVKSYKLGVSGTTVQIQNSSGTQYSGTPTYSVAVSYIRNFAAPSGTSISDVSWTNNDSGYHIISEGDNGSAGIIVGNEIKVNGGTSQNKYNYLETAPTNLYRYAYAKGKAAGEGTISSWSVGAESGKINVTANPQHVTKSVPVSISGSNSIASNGEYYYKVYYENADGDDVEVPDTSKKVTVTIPQPSKTAVYDEDEKGNPVKVTNITISSAKTLWAGYYKGESFTWGGGITITPTVGNINIQTSGKSSYSGILLGPSALAPMVNFTQIFSNPSTKARYYKFEVQVNGKTKAYYIDRNTLSS